MHREWNAREIGLLAATAVIGGTLIGFLSPVPEGVSTIAKVSQNSALLVVALTIAVLARRRG